jgi:hypothetical protein
MEKPIKIFFASSLIILLVGGFIACDKNQPQPGGETDNLVFDLLKSSKDTLQNGEQALIQAIASGTDLVYFWGASSGDILGSGSSVYYVPSPCVSGEVSVNCKIEDAFSNSDQKTIKLYVE